jgi:protein-tyrosine phosphatase
MREVIHPSLPPTGRLYAGPRPAQPFAESVSALRAVGITTVACLLESYELPEDLEQAYQQMGFELLRFPIQDFAVPRDPARFGQFLNDVLARLRRGEHLYVHCLGGIGRTGTLLCCLFKLLGVEGDPLTLVRSVYASVAVESPAQQRFVKDFDAGLSR